MSSSMLAVLCAVLALAVTVDATTPSGPSQPQCGNGVLDAGEACDDGNNLNGDGCSASCQIESGCTCNTPTSSRSQCDCQGNSNYLWLLLLAIPLCLLGLCCLPFLLDGGYGGGYGGGWGGWGGYGGGYGGGWWRGFKQQFAPAPMVPAAVVPPPVQSAPPALPVRLEAYVNDENLNMSLPPMGYPLHIPPHARIYSDHSLVV